MSMNPEMFRIFIIDRIIYIKCVRCDKFMSVESGKAEVGFHSIYVCPNCKRNVNFGRVISKEEQAYLQEGY